MAKKRAGTRCFCGRRLRPKDKHCARCGRVTRAGMQASLRKAVAATRGPAFIGKAAARMASSTAGMAMCGKGHWNRREANCCSTCAELMPGVSVPPMGLIGKSALATEYWRREMARSPDPSVRELYNRMRYGEGGAA
jgi:hypothetical protein